MASKYDSIRNRRNEGESARDRVLARAAGGSTNGESKAPTSRFDAIRNRTSNLSVGGTTRTDETYTARQNVNEQRLGGGVPAPTRPAESASARDMHEQRLEQNEPAPSVQPDFLKPQAKTGTYDAIRQFRKENPLPKESAPEPTAYEKFYQEKIAPTFIGKALSGLQSADRAVSDVKAGALDTATFGATQALGKVATKGTPLEEIRQERLQSTPYKVGEVLGYIPPGAAIERGVTKVGGKALEKLPSIAQGAIRGVATGAAEQTAQELGDVAFRNREFNPSQISINAGAGGALGAAIPAIGRGITKVRDKLPENWFTNLFGNQNVGITAGGGNKSGKAVTSGDVIVNKAIKEKSNNLVGSAIDTAKATHRNLVNRFEPLKQGGENVFEAAEDVSRANQIANRTVGKEFVDFEGNVVGEGLESIMKSVPRGEKKTFFDYLIVKDAQARVPRGERVFDEDIKILDPSDPAKMRHIELNTPEGLQARRDVLEKRYPWLVGLSKRWNMFNKNVREIYGVQEGLLSPDMVRSLEEARPDYVKMMRQFDRSEKPGSSLFTSSASDAFSGKSAPIKSVSKTGSARKIVDPARTTAESIGAWVNNGFRNRVGQELLKNIQANPEEFASIARIVPESPQATQQSVEEINRILREEGIDGLAKKTHDEFQAAFGKGKSSTTDNQITVFMNGKPVKIEILDPQMAVAMQGMSPTQLGLVLQVAKFGSDLTKRSATGVLAPAFAAKSALVDFPVALLQAKGNRARFAVDYAHALASGFASKIPGVNGTKLAKLAEDFARAGGGFSASLRSEKGLNKALRNLERNPIADPKNLYRAPIAAVKAPFQLAEGAANVFENAPRIAAAKGEIRRLGGEKTPENVRRSMQESREITVPYNRKGQVSDELEAISPYTNAAIQGSARLARQIKNKPFQTLAGITAIVGIPKAYEYSQFHDDPDYQRLPAREKFRNLIIDKNADGTFKKIPLEPSYAAFGAAALDFYQYVKNNDTDAFKGMTDSLSNAYLPPLVSGALQGVTQGAEADKSGIDKSLAGLVNATSASPAASILANQSFTGAPIDNAAVADRSPQYRYDEKTSAIAKWIGEKLKFSPMKIDYLLRQFGGDLARFGLPITSDVGAGTKQQTILRNFVVDPVFTNNLTNDFYTGKNLLATATRDNAEVDAPLPDWYDETLAKDLTTTKKGSINANLKDLTDKKKEVNRDKSLTAEEKSQKLRGIQREINNIYIDVNSRMADAGIPFPRR